jgi:type I restriction enzyme, S subunit
MLLDVRADHLKIVQEILRKFVPEREVWAFGSRAKWLAKEYSDLDLCIVGDSALSFRTLGLLEEAFEDSDLPYKVDVVDWATTSESFRKIIERDRVMVQEVGRGWTVQSRSFKELFGIPLRNGLTKPKAVRGAGTKMVNMGELFANPRIANIAMDRVPLNQAERSSSLLAAGDLLFARQSLVLSGAGKCSIFVGDDEDVCFESHVIRCRLNQELADPHFYYYFFSSPVGRTLMESIVEQGAGASGIRGSDLAELSVPWIDSTIQRCIAGVLSQIDDKIALNRRINQTLEAMAQAIFKSWFVDFDPVKAKIAAKQEGRDPLRAAMSAISGKLDAELDALPCEQYEQLATTAALFPDEMEESELGEIPKGWEVVSLYDTADYLNGAAFRASDFSEATEALPIIKIAELKQGVNSGTKRTLKEIDQKYKIESGDVLYSWSGSPDTSLEVFRWFGDKGLLNQHIFKLSFTQLGQREYTYYLLKEIKPILVATATQKQTTGLGHITVADMKRIKVTRPKLTELIHFTKQLIQIYATTANHERQSITLAALRDTLISKLLSGELSVAGIAPVIDEVPA